MFKVVLVFLLCISIGFAGSNTPEDAIDAYFGIEKKFHSIYRYYESNNENEKRAQITLESLYRETTTGKLLDDLLAKMDQFDVASCAGLDLFPSKPERIKNKSMTRYQAGDIALAKYDFEEIYFYNDVFPGIETFGEEFVTVPAQMFLQVRSINDQWLVEYHYYKYPQGENDPATLAGKD